MNDSLFTILTESNPELGALLVLLIVAIVALWHRDVKNQKRVDKARDRVEEIQNSYLGKLREVEVHLRSGASDRDKQLVAWEKIDDLHKQLMT